MDWDAPKLHVLGVSTSKGHARVEQSLAVALAHDLTTASASNLGRSLKDSLAAANIAPAPVLVALGRDKIILKEISIPFVPASEEAMVVRFQAAKEMTESASEVVFDYTFLSRPQAGQTTRVQVVFVRKAIVAAVTTLCQSAGLKLQAIVPRPFALAGLLDRQASSKSSVVRGLLLSAGAGEAEFCVYAGDRLEWARTLPAGSGLTADVAKNLMLLVAQKSELEVERIETAGIADLGDVGAPHEELKPWRDNDQRPPNPTPFLAALGLAEIAATSLPVNLAAPKEPKPVVNTNQVRLKYATIAAAILVPLLILGWYVSLSKKRSAIKDLEVAKEEYESSWKALEQERLDVAALKEWEQSTISWLDEFYDISARFPHVQGLRITQVAATQMRRRGPKDNFTGMISIHGLMNSDQDQLVAQFIESMQGDKYLKVQSPTQKANEFTVKIDVAPRPPLHHEARLDIPPPPKIVPPPVTEEKPEAPSDE
jgi:hypothetical protein